jgi:superfamily II DNA/RNA helicase
MWAEPTRSQEFRLSRTFADLGVPDDLVGVLRGQGIETPFPIQAASLPDAIAGHDICGRAPTGSGKTLAFGLALVARTKRTRPKRPTALVLVPTRELAAQVELVIRPIAAVRKLRVATVYGGTGYEKQRNALRHGVEILVACPGRLEDLLEQRDLSLADVGFVVVDEADRMADMGFLPAVKRLLDQTRADRQTLLYSATLDGDVDVLVRRYQKHPKRFDAKLPESDQGDVKHVFWHAERSERLGLVAALAERHPSSLVFCRTRHGAERLAKQLARSGVKAAAIHGSRSQPQREQALHAFSTGKVSVLVATDVAARGIHVDDVSCVVHFDPPGSDKDYVHRSGRTGRAGADGTVVTLVGREHVADVRAIQKSLRMPVRLDEPDLPNGNATWGLQTHTAVTPQNGNGNGWIPRKPKGPNGARGPRRRRPRR